MRLGRTWRSNWRPRRARWTSPSAGRGGGSASYECSFSAIAAAVSPRPGRRGHRSPAGGVHAQPSQPIAFTRDRRRQRARDHARGPPDGRRGHHLAVRPSVPSSVRRSRFGSSIAPPMRGRGPGPSSSRMTSEWSTRTTRTSSRVTRTAPPSSRTAPTAPAALHTPRNPHHPPRGHPCGGVPVCPSLMRWWRPPSPSPAARTGAGTHPGCRPRMGNCRAVARGGPNSPSAPQTPVRHMSYKTWERTSRTLPERPPSTQARLQPPLSRIPNRVRNRWTSHHAIAVTVAGPPMSST